MDVKFFLANLWRWKVGVPELPEPRPVKVEVDLDEMRRTEWSPEFERLMRNRLILGAYRYGRLNSTGKPQYNRIESVRKRLLLYENTGNTEYLVDCADLLLLEFEEGVHPNRHFKAIDDAEHVSRAGGFRTD